MTETKKSFSSSIKEALAKKHAAAHPESKDAKGDSKSAKRTPPPVGAGKVMKRLQDAVANPPSDTHAHVLEFKGRSNDFNMTKVFSKR